VRETILDRAKQSSTSHMTCRYFTHYGNACVPGSCHEEATLRLLSQPDILVCGHHASVISFRFPSLGTVEQRFVPLVPLVFHEDPT